MPIESSDNAKWPFYERPRFRKSLNLLAYLSLFVKLALSLRKSFLLLGICNKSVQSSTVRVGDMGIMFWPYKYRAIDLKADILGLLTLIMSLIIGVVIDPFFFNVL